MGEHTLPRDAAPGGIDTQLFVRRLKDCEEFVAGDATRLRELLHPEKVPLVLRYSVAHARVEPGRSSASHRLRHSEVYYILRGRGRMHVGSETSEVAEGDTLYVPPNAWQHIENTGNEELAFLCIVDPAWKIEDEEVRGAESSDDE
jgi:mannose-6-phosphate isomerase-like protein (cupin superfamily)